MIKNYLKSALRNLRKYKAHTLINIVGLSIGLASSFIIMLYALNEMSIDRHNKNLDNIYIATSQHLAFDNWIQPATPYLLGPALKNEFPEVQQFARCIRSRCPIKYKEKEFDEVRCLSSDLSIFEILTLPLETGSLEGLSKERDYVIISREMAKKIFGNSNPVGEVITVNWQKELYNLRVAAVMKDVPLTSSMRFEMVVPLSLGEKWIANLLGKYKLENLDSWNTEMTLTYVLTSPGSSPAQLENKMTSLSQSHVDPKQKIQFHLFPLKDVYFHTPSFVNNVFPTGNRTNLYVYSTIAVLSLVMACINFVILSTGRASVRTKEIAVRKVLGATRPDLIKQVMIESTLTSLMSLPAALLLVEFFLPTFTQLLGKRVSASGFHDMNYLLLFLGITLLAGIFAGSYVSFYLSGFRPMDILRNKLSTGGSRATLRKIMMAVQMVIFIGLITASLTIYKQMRYFHDKDMGYDKRDLLVLSGEYRRFGTAFEAFKTELKSDPSIIGVSAASQLPGTEGGSFGAAPHKSDPTKLIPYQILSVDREFIETMKMNMVSGQSFADVGPKDSLRGSILTETAVRAFGIKDPSTELFQGERIYGVVKDFNVRSLRDEIAPVVMSCTPQYVHEIAVRVSATADLPKTVKFVEAKSMALNEGKPMEVQFFDDRLDELYGNDYRFAKMIGTFTALAIFIACLGLLGVSLFVIQTRVKEIGIRKVMGASIGSVFYLVSREFILLGLLSTIIAIPVTTYFINAWLQNYAYRVSVDAFVVLYALLSAMVIVLVTISYQALRASKANPVDALRCE